MKKILVFTDWFEPGFKAGGPIRSCVNFAFHMKTDYEIFVFTTDRDLGDEAAYQDITINQWLTPESNLHIFYASPGFLSWKNILQLIKEINPAFIYLNSMFSRFFSLYPLLMKRFKKLPAKLVLAPRGMLKESALAYKSSKKKIFLSLFRTLRLPARIIFHVTDATEGNDVRKQFGEESSVTQITNFPGVQHPFTPVAEKDPASLKMIFVGRIHPIKNLSFLLDCLQQTSYSMDLTVIAPIEDQQYWNICRESITKLASRINVQLITNLPHDQLEGILLKHHLFVLPTKGENFGHAIYEALAAGRPVLISDQTPWRNLEQQRAGWDLPLTNAGAFVSVINKAAAMDLAELNDYCRKAWQYCQGFLTRSDIKKEYLKLFS